MDKLLNLHEILVESKLETAKRWNREPLGHKSTVFALRMRDELREVTEHICVSNGTTLQAFLRACAEQLIKEYSPRAHKAVV